MVPLQQVLVLAVLYVCCAVATPTLPCDCHSGTVVSPSPCTCSCPASLLLPFCAFTATDQAVLSVAINASSASEAQWSATELELALKTFYGLSSGSSSIVYQVIDSSSNVFTRAYSGFLCSRWLVTGSVAQQFLQEFLAGSARLTQVGVIGVAPFTPDVAPVGEAASASLAVAIMAFGELPLFWLVLLVAMLFVFVVECCVVSNTTEKSEAMQQEEQDLQKQAQADAMSVTASAEVAIEKFVPMPAGAAVPVTEAQGEENSGGLKTVDSPRGIGPNRLGVPRDDSSQAESGDTGRWSPSASPPPQPIEQEEMPCSVPVEGGDAPSV